MKQHQQGFGILGMISIIGIAAIIAVIGLNVATRQKATAPTISSAPVAKTDRCSLLDTLGATWKLATSAQLGFSMCIPGGWTMLIDAYSGIFEARPPFAIDKTRPPIIKRTGISGKDGSYDSVRVYTVKASAEPQDSSWQKTTFTLNDGMAGERDYKKIGQVTGTGFGPVEGEEDYIYSFTKGSTDYMATYVVTPGTTNQLSDVETVLKTLQIK